MSGVAGENTLTAQELESGKTNRMMVHLGKKLMLDTDWYGAWDSKENTEASKFADNYYELREKAVEHLSSQYQDILKKVKEGGAAYVVSPETRPITPRASVGTGSGTVDRYLRFWAPRSRPGTPARNMTMTERRARTVMTWPREDVQKFIKHAPLTAAAKRALRTALAGRTT